ncbi:MAG: protein kinase [Magnetococcales bacterium]|nr:protein kinase [Magnetococcales bacterium]
MGIVYEGYDPFIERTVAIKTIHKALLEGDGGQELLARFKREAQAAGRLMHQNVVAIYEYGEDQGIPFIAMEFIKGKELKDYIRDQARFEMDKIVEIMDQTLDAMEYVHRGGVVHRDMKPANIIILDDGQVKVADFGIARVESSTMTQMGAVMGTPSYMSPEQFMGQRVDARADLFSMGVILYELLTGEKPFPGKAVATIMQKVLNTEAEDPSNFNFNIPTCFNDLIRKALAKRPGDRFQDAGSFREAIKLAAKNQYKSDLDDGDDDATILAGGVDEDDEATVMAAGGGLSSTDATVAATNPASAQTVAMAPNAMEAETIITAAPGGDATVATPPPGTISGGEPKKSSMGLVIGIIGLLVVAGGGGAWWFTRPAPAPTKAQPTATPPAAIQPQTAPPATATTPTAPEPPVAVVAKGTISAASEPTEAMILMDGEFMGFTPNTFEMPPGEYQLILKKNGFHDMEASIEVVADEVLEFEVALDPVEPGG